MAVWHFVHKSHDRLISTRINSGILNKLDLFCSKYWLTRADAIELLIESHLVDLLKFRY